MIPVVARQYVSKQDLLALKDANEKVAWEEERRSSSYNHAMPVHLTLETTMVCNLRCVMCQVFRSPETIQRAGVADSVMPLELFEKIAREAFPAAKEMTPTVMGEPLLTPYLSRILEVLAEYSMKMNLVTSGMHLSPEISARIIPHLRKIKVSFDGATKPTFEAIRRGAEFERVIENVRQFNTARQKLAPRERPILAFQVTLMRRNIEELPTIVELAAELGVDEVIGLHVYVFDKDFESQSLLHHKELSDTIIREAVEKAKPLGVYPHFPAPFSREEDDLPSAEMPRGPPRLCKFLWREVWVSHTGDVTPCCVPDRPVMGNLRTSTLAEIWNGPLYKEMRSRLGTDDPYDCCRHCSLATQYEKGLGNDYDEKRFFLYEKTADPGPANSS